MSPGMGLDEDVAMTTLDLESLETVTGGRSCGSQAKREAIQFSARQNHVDPSTIRATDMFSAGRTKGTNYYGVHLDNGENVNVGLSNATCKRRNINYVTDGA